ncbi:DUF3825 domain-containing protein [Thermophilibacter sp.]
MPKMSAGNRLYLYQLLSRELGVGRQTLLPRAEEALAADGLEPADLGFENMRALCEQLSEFVKLTVFKKGTVYATVLPCEEYDRALAHAGADKTPSDKPWKRRKGAKALRPVKPRHVERVAEEPEDEAAGAGATGLEPQPEPAQEAAELEAANVPEPEPEAAVAPEPEPEPEPAPEPAPARKPAIALNITYDPGEEDASPEVAPVSEPQPGPAPARRADELPHDFHADVRCPSELLSTLYQVLPPDVDPLSTLEEDFRVARSTGALDGTRSNVTFSLRYLRSDGSAPVRVTLRRSARPVGGKRWALAEVDAGAAEEVGLEGLSDATRGPWSAFAALGDVDAPDPERALAQEVALGSWDDVLERLAALAAPEDWGPRRRVLRACLTMAFDRVRAQGLLHVADDGASADFDTGLLSTDGLPIHARLAARPGDIPWELKGFSTEGPGRPAVLDAPAALRLFDPTLPAPDVPGTDALARSPRLSTAAYDPIAHAVRLLVPADGGALALDLVDGAYVRVAELALEDAYACARTLGSEQPSWLLPRR